MPITVMLNIQQMLKLLNKNNNSSRTIYMNWSRSLYVKLIGINLPYIDSVPWKLISCLTSTNNWKAYNYINNWRDIYKQKWTQHVCNYIYLQRTSAQPCTSFLRESIQHIPKMARVTRNSQHPFLAIAELPCRQLQQIDHGRFA